jgi:hypothetical protein
MRDHFSLKIEVLHILKRNILSKMIPANFENFIFVFALQNYNEQSPKL